MAMLHQTAFLRRTLLAAVITWSAACTGPTPDDEPGPATAASYWSIIGGQEETGRGYVGLVLNNAAGGLCTGALVSERVVLTAKHCVQAADADGPVAPTQLAVRFGPAGTASFLPVAAVDAAPGVYTIGPFGAEGLVGTDLALLTLKDPSEQVPLRLKLTAPDDEKGKVATAVGYGKTPSGAAGVKYAVDTEVVALTPKTIRVVDTVCEGDSGGPLINADGATFGVVSYGTSERCAPGSFASFYQRIDVWASLIRETIAKSGGCADTGAEVCDGFDNDCDKQVDEDCAQFGAACQTDANCASRVCAESGTGRFCSARCDPESAQDSCVQGYDCVRAEDCEGACANAGACLPERSVLGEPCATDADCQSGLCHPSGSCSQRCESDLACGTGFACVNTKESGGLCLAATETVPDGGALAAPRVSGSSGRCDLSPRAVDHGPGPEFAWLTCAVVTFATFASRRRRIR